MIAPGTVAASGAIAVEARTIDGAPAILWRGIRAGGSEVLCTSPDGLGPPRPLNPVPEKTMADAVDVQSPPDSLPWHRDPSGGVMLDRWLARLAVPSPPEREPIEMIQHGWLLVQWSTLSGTSTGGPADVDALLAALERGGWIVRRKRELGYAPEIMAFGVGGEPGHQLNKANYPCLFGWAAAQRLNVFWHWRLRFADPALRDEKRLRDAMKAWSGIHPSKVRGPK